MRWYVKTDWTVNGELRGISRQGAKVEVQKERRKRQYTGSWGSTGDAVHTQELYTFKYLDFNCTTRLPLYFALKLVSKNYDIFRKMYEERVTRCSIHPRFSTHTRCSTHPRMVHIQISRFWLHKAPPTVFCTEALVKEVWHFQKNASFLSAWGKRRKWMARAAGWEGEGLHYIQPEIS